MPKVIFLPNEEFCPEGMVVDAATGDNLLEVAHIGKINDYPFLIPKLYPAYLLLDHSFHLESQTLHE